MLCLGTWRTQTSVFCCAHTISISPTSFGRCLRGMSERFLFCVCACVCLCVCVFSVRQPRACLILCLNPCLVLLDNSMFRGCTVFPLLSVFSFLLSFLPLLPTTHIHTHTYTFQPAFECVLTGGTARKQSTASEGDIFRELMSVTRRWSDRVKSILPGGGFLEHGSVHETQQEGERLKAWAWNRVKDSLFCLFFLSLFW